MIQAYPLIGIATQRVSRSSRGRFTNDRQAVRLKILLIGVCLIAAALLEVPR